jgi:uncharacterized membrane protein
MNKSRLEAFSDGVFAIIITIMVLELKVPEGGGLSALAPLFPVFLSYILSFIFIGIYWVNHHHLMHTLKKVNGGIMWANMHLLFWLSLIPFATGWMGINDFDKATVGVYGCLLLFCGLAFTLLSKCIRDNYKQETALTAALAKSDVKGKLSALLYAASVPIAWFINPAISAVLFVTVSVMWIIPSKAIERALENEEH